jgi:hypothetical protein
MDIEKEKIEVRDRLKSLINIIPHTLVEIAEHIGISYLTLVGFLNKKRMPKRLTFIKIRNYVVAIENQLELEDAH